MAAYDGTKVLRLSEFRVYLNAACLEELGGQLRRMRSPGPLHHCRPSHPLGYVWSQLS